MAAPRLDYRSGAPARRWRSKKGGTPEESAARQALGRSRGGLTTKLHAATDALGNPARMLLTPGHAADVPQAAALIAGLSPAMVIADTAYDAMHFRSAVALLGAESVIPSSATRTSKFNFDKEVYAERNRVERFFHRLKLNRRLATRYEKTARNYLSFALWASTLVLLR